MVIRIVIQGIMTDKNYLKSYSIIKFILKEDVFQPQISYLVKESLIKIMVNFIIVPFMVIV